MKSAEQRAIEALYPDAYKLAEDQSGALQSTMNLSPLFWDMSNQVEPGPLKFDLPPTTGIPSQDNPESFQQYEYLLGRQATEAERNAYNQSLVEDPRNYGKLLDDAKGVARKQSRENIYQQLKGQSENLGTAKTFQTGAAGGKEGGLGSTDAVMRDMAEKLATSGLTSIEHLGQRNAPVIEDITWTSQPEYRNEIIGYGENSYLGQVPTGNYTWQATRSVFNGSMGEGSYYTNENVPITPEIAAKLGDPKARLGESVSLPTPTGEYRQEYYNKATGDSLKLLSGYDGRGWSGTSAGDGQTIYNVQFDPATGLPIFYNQQKHGKDDYADLIKIAAIGSAIFAPQIGAAILGAGAPAAAALAVGSAVSGFIGSGGDIKEGIKAGLASYLGGQAGSWASGATNSALVGNIAGNMTRAAILGGNMEQALVSSLVQAAPAEISKYIPNFKDLPRAVQETAVAATVDMMRSGGDNLGQIALQGAAKGATDYAVSQIDGYKDLRPAQQEIIRSRLSNVLGGESLSNELLQGAIQMGSESVQNEVNNEKAHKAGWSDYATQQAAKSLYGDKVTPDLYADKQDTTEAEAKAIARDILGREPTEFEYMQLIGLPEREAAQNSDLQAVRYDESTFDSNELVEAYKGLYGKEPTDEWLAENMDLLGRSDAQGKNMLESAYTKDKNWVTEDEAEQFWKDMGNTGPVPQEFLDSMLMTTESGAKAMAETHRINAEDIAATTFDGSQYATPQEAADAAKAAGFNAFTHKDKNLTYFTQPSPIEEANIRADVEEKKTFNEAFAAARKELGAGKTFTWNGKQYTTNVMPKDTFDASRSSDVTTAATLAYANGKDKFIGPDGKTYKLDDSVKSVLDNSVNQSAAETQRLLRQAIKPATDETSAETQRLMESGTRGTMDTIGAMTAQALGTTQRGLGNFLSNAGKTYAAITGDLDFDNAAIRFGKEVENYAKGNDIYGLDVQKNRLSQAMARANETDNWIEKTKILGSAIGNNSLGFFDVAGSEVVEEIPETILQIGAALMSGGGTLAASGAVAAIGAAGSVMETFGSTVEETYDKAKKAGFSNSEAMDKAYLNGVLSTAIEAGTNFVADKALLAPFLNKFTGTLAGTATGFVSSTAIGAASELAAGLSQSYATQYMINPETASLSKAATDGIFEMFIGATAQGTMGLPGYAIQGGAIIGKDYSGRDVTMADVAAGAVLDSSTVNPNATIATSEDGDPVTLGGAMLQMPNYQFDMSTLKTYVPQVFSNDSLIIGQDELGNTVTYGDLMGQTTESKGFDAVYKNLLDITPEQRTEAKYEYVADLFGDKGYTPTAQEINDLIAQNPSVSQIDASDVEQYITSKPVTPPTTTPEVSPVDSTPTEPTPVPEAPPATDGQVISVNPDDGTALVVDGNGNVNVVDNTDGILEPGDIIPATPPAEPEVPATPAEPTEPTIPTEPELPLEPESPFEPEVPVEPELPLEPETPVVPEEPSVTPPAEPETPAVTPEAPDITGQITDVETRLTDAIAAAEAMGLSRDQAITDAVESVAADLGTTKADLLTQLGTTEEALRTEFGTGLAGVSAEVKAAYDSLSAEQKALADQLNQQGTDLATAIQTVQQETAGQIGALSADVQAKYDALTAEQKALADAMNQQGLDLTAAIDLAAQQTQAQITGLGESVDTRINELMQQGQTYQQATQQAIGELTQQNQQLQGLVGTQGRQATQADIDALSQMLGGQRSMDLTYDVTGDKQITQADIDFLTQVVSGVNTDWRAPVGSAFGPTGLYGQLATNEAQRQADARAQLAREEAARQAEAERQKLAAAEAQRQGKISAVRGTLAQTQQGIQGAAQQLPQAFQQAQQVSTPLYGTMEYFDPFGDPFAENKMRMASSTNPADQTKMAAGGYIDDLLAGEMTVDDLLDLLR